MKRFLVFAFDHYYPKGGMNDFKGSFDTKEEAIAFSNTLQNVPDESWEDWEKFSVTPRYDKVVIQDTQEIVDEPENKQGG